MHHGLPSGSASMSKRDPAEAQLSLLSAVDESKDESEFNADIDDGSILSVSGASEKGAPPPVQPNNTGDDGGAGAKIPGSAISGQTGGAWVPKDHTATKNSVTPTAKGATTALGAAEISGGNGGGIPSGRSKVRVPSAHTQMSHSTKQNPGSGSREILKTFPLQEWIRESNSSYFKEDYLQCAVTVALALTNRLCLVAGTSEESSDLIRAEFDSWGDSAGIRSDFPAVDEGLSSSSLAICIEDIVPENVLVSVANNISHGTSRAGFMPMEVTILRPKSSVSSQPPRPSSRDVCFALGTILFQLFSRGDPLLQVEQINNILKINSNEEEDLFRDWLLEGIGSNDDGAAPAASKKSTLSSAATNSSPPTSMKAKKFLQEQGVPLSVCCLVSDLLENERGNEYISDTAIRSMREARFDLVRMKNNPQRFLHDQTSPEKALADTALSDQAGGELYGRENEMNALMDTAGRVKLHSSSPRGRDNGMNNEEKDAGMARANDFLCEATFLSGHTGSGKSSIIRKLVSSCNENGWIVLFCKFDGLVAPLSALLHSIDSLFAKIRPMRGEGGGETPLQVTFERISQPIIASIDTDSFAQLCELLPNFCENFPMAKYYIDHQRIRTSYSINELGDLTGGTNMGSGRNRLKYLLHIVFKGLCSGGHPVLLCMEDMHWADAATLDIVGDFILSIGQDSVYSVAGQSLHGGLFYLGSFRDNAVDEDGFVMNQIKCMEQSQQNIIVRRIVIGGIAKSYVNKMLSFKFCLPMRYTRELSQLVYQKTRGYPMFTIEFLKSAMRSKVLVFSVRDRRWVWDEISIDMQMISESVVELLTKNLKQLPGHVLQTLKVMSCFGSQIDLSMIHLLDSSLFAPNMVETLGDSMKEGIVDRAGPIFAFSHDMLQETSYKLMPVHERAILHKRIATSLIRDSRVDNNFERCLLAVDQVNNCKDFDGILSSEEKAQFARLNLEAGKHSAHASSYEQARAYFEAGITLLHANHWHKQYSLSLQLYKWSAAVSFMDGKVENISNRLNDILSNTKSSDDKLNARAMLAKFSVSQERYADGVRDIIDLLSDLGEIFPEKTDQTYATNEILSTLPLLNDITREKILDLPVIADQRKRSAMKFLGLLITFCNFYSPIFVHSLSCRILKLTFQFGFCEDTIAGLVAFSHGLWLHSENMAMSKQILKIADTLIRENPNEHVLRGRLTLMRASVSCATEPAQAETESLFDGYTSASIVGDTDSAMICGLLYCVASFLCNANLMDCQRKIEKFLHEMAKRKRTGLLHSLMSFYWACTALIGNEESCRIYSGIEMKTITELYQIAEETQNTYLLHHVILTQMCVHCYFRDYFCVTALAQKYEMNHTAKRALDSMHFFYEGISALVLARDTGQEKWRRIGEKSVQSMAKYAEYSIWNFENKLYLLQAELYYLNGCQGMAEPLYRSAITSARKHKFVHEEALAQELCGIFFVKNRKLTEGMQQLNMATETYRKWGAMKKADDVQAFVQTIQPSTD